MPETAISLKDVGVSFGRKKILQDITLDINKGEVVGIHGQNGAGKSTLLSVLAGILKTRRGEVNYFGEKLKSSKSKLGNFIAYVSQETVLYNSLTGLQNLRFWAGVNGVGEDRVKKLIVEMNLSEFVHEKVGRYSGGMRRRLNIATSLLNEPLILLLDEPTANLDEESKDRVIESVLKYKNQGVTIIIVSHIMGDLMQICGRILTLQEGRITGEVDL
ncbi:MAG: ABC transporter ATP-binding protein [Bacillota bacterium]